MDVNNYIRICKYTLEEFGTHKKTLTLIKQSKTSTKSKVKFFSEISDSFEIKTAVRQGDGLSSILFNCVLGKVIRKIWN